MRPMNGRRWIASFPVTRRTNTGLRCRMRRVATRTDRSCAVPILSSRAAGTPASTRDGLVWTTFTLARTASQPMQTA